jgi:hypothetical protein
MNTHFTKTLSIAYFAFALPLGANAADTTVTSALATGASTAVEQPNPVRITGVQVTKAWHTDDKFDQPRMVNITFANQSPLTATEIVFSLRDSGGRVINQYKDVGKYTQGQSVTHGFFDLHVPQRFQMSAVKVTFADGSVWATTEQTPPSRRQASDDGLDD